MIKTVSDLEKQIERLEKKQERKILNKIRNDCSKIQRKATYLNDIRENYNILRQTRLNNYESLNIGINITRGNYEQLRNTD